MRTSKRHQKAVAMFIMVGCGISALGEPDSGISNTSPRLGARLQVEQSRRETVFVGGKVTLWVKPPGKGEYQVAWRKGAKPIEGANGKELTIESVRESDAGDYSALLTQGEKFSESDPIFVTVRPAPNWKLSPPGKVVSMNGPAVPEGLTDVVAIAAGKWHGLAVRKDGTVAQFGKSGWIIEPPEPPAGLSNVVAVAAGKFDSLALKADGTVVGWGRETPEHLYGVVAVAAGVHRSMALKCDGTIVSWGGPPNPPASAGPATAIGMGECLGATLKPDGRVFVWGNEAAESLVSNWSDVATISTGPDSILGLTRDGQVLGTKAPAGLRGVSAIAAGHGDFGLALKSDGTLEGWGGAVIPANLTGVTAIAAGGFGLAITTNPPPQSFR